MARMASGILRRFGGRKLAVDVRLVVCLCGRLSAEVFRLATIGARMDEASPNAFGRSPGVTAEQASNVHQAPYRSLQLSHCSWRHGRSARPLIGRSERGQRHERTSHAQQIPPWPTTSSCTACQEHKDGCAFRLVEPLSLGRCEGVVAQPVHRQRLTRARAVLERDHDSALLVA
jgi:hypothetical protein